MVLVQLADNDVFGTGLLVGRGADGLPSLLTHPRHRPAALHGPLQPHLGVRPIQRRLKVAPIQPGVLLVVGTELLVDPPQPPDVLRCDVAHLLAPGFVAISRGRGLRGDQRIAPLGDNSALLPVRRANQTIPSAQILGRGLFHLGRLDIFVQIEFGQIEFGLFVHEKNPSTS